ncbi:MAG: hypothetical protein ACFFE2_16800 [Candidatus Thorarchaeota archaeon]
MYEGEVERSSTAKRVMVINIFRAAIYYSVVGIQWVHCSTESVTCDMMILLVPLILGVLDMVLVWASGRDTIVVKIVSIALSIASITVATITFSPILIETTQLNIYQLYMLFLSLSATIISVIELLVVSTSFATSSGKDDIILDGSERTYERWG